MWYECLAFRRPACFCFVVVLCFMSVVLGGWVYWSVVGWGSLSPVFKWFPRVVLGLGLVLLVF